MNTNTSQLDNDTPFFTLCIGDIRDVAEEMDMELTDEQIEKVVKMLKSHNLEWYEWVECAIGCLDD